MFRHKNRTAVLKRLDGSLISIYLFRNIYNFLLIKAYHRTEYRHSTHSVRRRQALHGLARHLPDALACNQSQAARFFCKMFRNPHHIAPHNNCQLLMRARLIDIKLDIRKVHYMQVNRP